MNYYPRLIIFLFAFIAINVSSIYAANLSANLATLEDKRNFYISLLNDKNLVIVTNEIQIRFGLDTTVSLRQLADAVRDRVIYNNQMVPDYDGDPMQFKISKIIENVLQVSNNIKRRLRKEKIPDLEWKIRDIKQQIAQQNNGNNFNPSNNYVSSGNTNSSSFSSLMNNLTSDEHLNSISYDNIMNGTANNSANQNSNTGINGGNTYSSGSISYDNYDSVNNTNQNPNVRFNNRGTGPQCLDQNPDNSRNIHKFDTNNNPNDNTYIECGYFKNGQLQYQVPYTNGKKDGIQLGYIHKIKPGRYLTSKIDWRAGKRNYSWTWITDKNGNVYKSNERAYSFGVQSNNTSWHPNGVKKSYTDYKPNGRAGSSYQYNLQGKLMYCTTWDSKGRSHTSHQCN